MVTLDDTPDDTGYLLISIDELGGTTTTAEVNDKLDDDLLDLDAINYRLTWLEEHDLVVLEQRGTDDTGRQLSKRITLTDAGTDLAATARKQLQHKIASPTNDLSTEDIEAMRQDIEELTAAVEELQYDLEMEAGRIDNAFEGMMTEPKANARFEELQSELRSVQADISSLREQAEEITRRLEEFIGWAHQKFLTLSGLIDGFHVDEGE